MESRLIEGFGETHTTKEWARRLGIPTSVLNYLTWTAGKTMAEIVDFCGKQYPSAKCLRRHDGTRMAETRGIMTELLRRSGYQAEPYQIGVTYACRTTHVITYAGRLLGAYDYSTGKLSGGIKGQTLKLKGAFFQENNAPKIRLMEQGGWERMVVPDLPEAPEEEMQAYYRILRVKYGQQD